MVYPYCEDVVQLRKSGHIGADYAAGYVTILERRRIGIRRTGRRGILYSLGLNDLV